MKKFTLLTLLALFATTLTAAEVPQALQDKALMFAPEIDTNGDNVVTIAELEAIRDELPKKFQRKLNEMEAAGITDNKQEAEKTTTEQVEKTEIPQEQVSTPAPKRDLTDTDHTKGRRVLFMGHSFFKNTVDYVPMHMKKYGLANHYQENVYRWGPSGAPGSMWKRDNGEVTIAKEKLRKGEFDCLAMTYYPGIGSTVQDYSNWLDLAIQGNKDIRFYIYLPWKKYKGQSIDEYKAESLVGRKVAMSIFDEVEKKYPNNKVTVVPMGDFMMKLWELYEAGKLKEIDALQLDKTQKDKCLFIDKKGHAGTIPSKQGAMLWLASLYNVDLNTYDYDTGTATDLRPIAQEVIDNLNR